MIKHRPAIILMQAAFVAVAWTVPMCSYAAPGQQLKPALQAIDPSKLQTAPIEEDLPAQSAAPAAANPNLEQMIPEFGKPDPAVPPSMSRPMPPGPGWAAGYAPGQPPTAQPPGGSYPMDVMQAPNAPDDPRVAKLEQIAFGSTYPEHDTDDRIEHLEREAFGKTFQGDNESRLQRLLAKYSPQGAFNAAPTGRGPQGWTPQTVAPTTSYQPQPPQYQPQAYQQPATMPQGGYPPPQQMPAYMPPAQQQQAPPQQTAYMPPQQQQQAPPQQPAYMPPQQQQGYPPQQTAYAPPQQTAYAPPQQPYYQPQQPQYQPPPPMMGGQPSVMASPNPTVGSAPPSIPSGPVTMGSFNRQQNPYAGAPPSIPTQPYQPMAPQQAMQQAPQQQAWQQPQQQVPYPPNGAMPPQTVAMGAPPTIPQGPVTMGSFNRQPTQQPVQQRPPQQPPRQTPRQPQQQAQPKSQQPVVIPGLENLPQYDRKAGDYSQQVIRLGGSFARWTSFPIRVHIPMNTQDNWRAAIDGAVKKWSQFIPVMIAPPNEPADIEIGWINHLMPRQLGITNLEIFNGHPRVTIYLLRPSYYPPDITEASLQRVALHQIGHGLGLFGHSNNPADAMFALDTPVKSGLPKTPSVTMRDVNTLRKIYEAQPLPDGFQSPQPISWP